MYIRETDIPTSFAESRDWFELFFDDVFAPPKLFNLVIQWLVTRLKNSDTGIDFVVQSEPTCRPQTPCRSILPTLECLGAVPAPTSFLVPCWFQVILTSWGIGTPVDTNCEVRRWHALVSASSPHRCAHRFTWCTSSLASSGLQRSMVSATESHFRVGTIFHRTSDGRITAFSGFRPSQETIGERRAK